MKSFRVAILQDIEDNIEGARSSARTMAAREKKRGKKAAEAQEEEDDYWTPDVQAEWERFSSSANGSSA